MLIFGRPRLPRNHNDLHNLCFKEEKLSWCKSAQFYGRSSLQCPWEVSGSVCIHICRWSVVSFTLCAFHCRMQRWVCAKQVLHFHKRIIQDLLFHTQGINVPGMQGPWDWRWKEQDCGLVSPFFLVYRWESALGKSGDVPRSSGMGYSLNQASNAREASVALAAPPEEQWTSARLSLSSTGGREALMFLISVYPCLRVSRVTFPSLLFGTTWIISRVTSVQRSRRLAKIILNN